MPRKSEITQAILNIVKEKKVCTARRLSEYAEKEYGVKISPGCASYRLWRLWKSNSILRSVSYVVSGSKRSEYVYSVSDLLDRTIRLELNGKIQEIKVAEFKSSSTPRHLLARSIIKDVFDAQERPEPLFSNEILLIAKQRYGCDIKDMTLASALGRMVRRRGEVARSRMKFEEGYLYHPDARVIDNWIQNPPHKGLQPDEKCLLQLIRERTVLTSSDIRKEGFRGRNSLPTSFSTIAFKIHKLKQLIPWIRTEYYAANTIVYDASTNPEALEEKLKQVRFWLSDLGKRKSAYGHEFESFCAHIFYDKVYTENKEWFSTDIEVEKNKRGRFGEFDLLLSHSFGPPEFGLKETLVFEFKTAGRVQWRDLFGYDMKRHYWGFVTKLEKEKEEGMFRGKFVRPILVLAHTIESGLPYELSRRGVRIIYMSDLLGYLERKGINPDSILEATNAKYYRP